MKRAGKDLTARDRHARLRDLDRLMNLGWRIVRPDPPRVAPGYDREREWLGGPPVGPVAPRDAEFAADDDEPRC